MRSVVTIRAAGEGDVEVLLPMVAALDEQHRVHRPDVFSGSSQRPRPREYVAGVLSAPDSVVLVAELDERIVGYVLVRMRDVDQAPLVRRRFGLVDALFVEERARHRGIGGELMNAADAWVWQQGGTAIELVVWEFNEPAIRFYEARGYSTDFRRLRRTLAPHV